MNFIINASIVKSGGAVQVADSFIRMLSIFSTQKLLVVLSPQLASLEKEVEQVMLPHIYIIRFRVQTFLGGIDKFSLDIIESIRRIRDNFVNLTLIGTDPCQSKVDKQALMYDWLNYLGSCTYSEGRRKIFMHDLLVLLCKYDGWRAVVNEAVQCGMRVLASDNCGAGTFDNKKRGGLFRYGYNLDSELLCWLSH